jgi:23S rRNA (uridine2552-2'-O)-methyltransferase
MKKSQLYSRPDAFSRRAKEEGYPARSVYKLEEIDRRTRLLRPGQRVLDLGAAPGSWAMYTAKKIGPTGRLLAIDLNPLTVALPRWAEAREGDALTLANEDLALFAPYDVVLSDMAPQTTGNRLGDQTRSFELFMRALAVAATLTKVGGSFVGKIFMGEDMPLARAELKRLFAKDKTMRPEGTRSVSYETFGIGLDRRP